MRKTQVLRIERSSRTELMEGTVLSISLSNQLLWLKGHGSLLHSGL